MMTELTRVGILRAGKVGAIVYSLLGVVFLPFALLGAAADAREGFVIIIVLVLYPLIGFLGCMLGAALYNLAARLGGGLLLEFEQVIDTQGSVSPEEVPYGPPEQNTDWRNR